MKLLVIAFFICAASAASITPSKQDSEEKAVIKAAAEVASVTAVASELGASAAQVKGASPVVASETVPAPVVASEVVAAAVTASEVIAAHASEAAAPVVKSEVVSTPVVTSEVITAPFAALKTVEEPTVEVAQVAPVVKEVKPGKDADAVILHEKSVVNSEGFKYAFENDNGIGAKATGDLKKVGDVSVVTTRGSYKYVGADGVPVEVTYTADETGFHPQSDILPVAPKIPVAIARALAFIASRPAKPETKDIQ